MDIILFLYKRVRMADCECMGSSEGRDEAPEEEPLQIELQLLGHVVELAQDRQRHEWGEEALKESFAPVDTPFNTWFTIATT